MTQTDHHRETHVAPTRSRMAEPLTGTGTAPVLDAVTPEPAAEPADALAALLAGDAGAGPAAGDNPKLTDDERAALRELARVKSQRSDYQRREKALGRRARVLQDELLAVLDDPDREMDYDRPFEVFEADGSEVRPYVQRPRFPRYRDADESGNRYTSEDLTEAVRETGIAEITAMITVAMSHKDWTSWVATRVQAWRAMLGDSDAGRMIEGRYVDYDGEPLDADEQGDPSADALALPRAVRVVVDVVPVPDIRFTRSPVASGAVAAADAAQSAAEAAQAGGPADQD